MKCTFFSFVEDKFDLTWLSFCLFMLAPRLLSQIDTWCKENNYVIAGYYQANERTKDSRYTQKKMDTNTLLFQENNQL